MHELLAAYVGFEPQLTPEEAQKQGAMNIAEFYARFKQTGGKVEGVGHAG